MSNWNDCQRLIEEVIARFGRLDILINNAGVVSVSSIASFSRFAPCLIHMIYAHNLEKIRANSSGEPRYLEKK